MAGPSRQWPGPGGPRAWPQTFRLRLGPFFLLSISTAATSVSILIHDIVISFSKSFLKSAPPRGFLMIVYCTAADIALHFWAARPVGHVGYEKCSTCGIVDAAAQPDCRCYFHAKYPHSKKVIKLAWKTKCPTSSKHPEKDLQERDSQSTIEKAKAN